MQVLSSCFSFWLIIIYWNWKPQEAAAAYDGRKNDAETKTVLDGSKKKQGRGRASSTGRGRGSKTNNDVTKSQLVAPPVSAAKSQLDQKVNLILLHMILHAFALLIIHIWLSFIDKTRTLVLGSIRYEEKLRFRQEIIKTISHFVEESIYLDMLRSWEPEWHFCISILQDSKSEGQLRNGVCSVQDVSFSHYFLYSLISSA